MKFANGLRLLNRALLRVEGTDAALFLQGLITKDVQSINENRLEYALLLNVKGRIKFDLFVYKQQPDAYLLEADSAALTNLENTLKIYRLKRKIHFTQLPATGVYFTASQPPPNSDVFEDPRASGFGYRFLNDVASLKFNEEMSMDDYSKRRMEWGIPEGLDELDDQIPMNMNADIMNGISYEKGCYIGQELVARTHHTGLVRRRIFPFKIGGDDSAIGHSQIVQGRILVDENKKKQARIIKSQGPIGIALAGLDQSNKKLFDESGNPVKLHRPKWWPSAI